MNELIKPRTKLCLLAALSVAAFVASPLPGQAREREGTKETATGPTKGVPPKARSGELEAIQARANAAAPGATSKDPKVASRAQAQLDKVHADLVAYAKANGLKLTTKEYTHDVGFAARQQACPGTKGGCTLIKSYIGKDGKMHCVYDCPGDAGKGGVRSQ